MTKADQGKVAAASGHADAICPGQTLDITAKADAVARARFGVEEGTL
ncbi:MAG: hypothetical protein RIR59_1469 [Pseudomonadota bacterium]